MFVAGKDFVCEDKAGVVLCRPRTPEAAGAFKVVQLQLARYLPKLPHPPRVEIEIDGVIAPSTALGVQMIVERLMQRYPIGGLDPIFVGAPGQTIEGLATLAAEISAYIARVMDHDPNVLAPPPMPEFGAQEDPVEWAKKIFTPKRLIAGAAIAATAGGLLAVGIASRNRGLGLVDRSRFLPEPEGGDDDGYEGDDLEHDAEADSTAA